MKKVLVFQIPGQEFVWDISAENQRDAAYLDLFKFQDGRKVYSKLSLTERQLYSLAKRGNTKYVEAFLLIRAAKEDEKFREVILQSGPSPIVPGTVHKIESPGTLAEPPALS